MNKALLAGIGIVLVSIIIIYASQSNITVQDTSDPTSQVLGLTGEISIGEIVPLTGDWSSHGIENHEGSKLAVKDFNEYLKEIGASWHLKMVSEDSATSPVIALEKATVLNAKGIKVIIGPETSANIQNMRAYTNSNNMLLLSCCSSAPSLAIPDDSLYRLVPDDSQQGVALAKLLKHEKVKVMIPVWRGDTWGDGIQSATEDSFTQRGGFTDDGIRYNPDVVEFSTSISILNDKVQSYQKEYNNDEIGILFLGFDEVLQFIQSASEYDNLDKVRWLTSSANVNESSLIDDKIGSEFSSKVSLISIQVAASNSPKYERVQEYIFNTMGNIPSTYVYTAYDAVWLIGLSILEAQSNDVDAIKDVLPTVAAEYNGAVGSTKLNDAGDLDQSDYELWEIRDGEWVILGQYITSDDLINIES